MSQESSPSSPYLWGLVNLKGGGRDDTVAFAEAALGSLALLLAELDVPIPGDVHPAVYKKKIRNQNQKSEIDLWFIYRWKYTVSTDYYHFTGLKNKYNGVFVLLVQGLCFLRRMGNL